MTRMRTRLLLGLSLLAAVAARPAAQQPAAGRRPPPNSRGHLPRRSELRRGGCGGVRSSGPVRQRPHARRFPGAGGRRAAGGLRLHARQHSDRARRAAAVSRACRSSPTSPRTRSRSKDACTSSSSTTCRPAASRSMLVRRAARQFIEQAMAANDMAAIVYTSGRGEAGQEFTSSKRLLLASVDRFLGRKLRSTTLERLDQYQRQASTGARRAARIPIASTIPLDMERGRDARALARRAQEHQRLHRRHPRASQGHRLPERGHRLRRLRLQQPRGIDDPGFDAGGHRVGHQGEREHLWNRPARPDVARRGFDRGQRRLSSGPSA